MTRGYLMFISNDKNTLHGEDPAVLNSRQDFPCICSDGVQNADLLAYMLNLGLPVRRPAGEQIFELRVDRKAREDFFASRLQTLKSSTSMLTLDEFLQSEKANLLERLIHDDQADLLCMNGEPYTIDTFMRNANDGTWYVWPVSLLIEDKIA